MTTAAVVLVGGLATAGRAPVGSFGIPAGRFRWLWPLAAFVSFAVVATLVRRLARGPARSARLVGAFAVATAVIAALNLPTSGPDGRANGVVPRSPGASPPDGRARR